MERRNTNETDFESVENEAGELTANVETFDVKDPASYQLAAECLKHTKASWNHFEDARKIEVKPIDEERKSVQAKYKKTLERAEKAMETLKGKLLAYHAQVEANLRGANERAAKLIASGQSREAIIAIEQATSMMVEVAGINRKTLWRFRVTDASAVERKFLMVDEKKIQAIVSATKGETDLAGIEAYPETIIEVRLGGEEVGHG